MSTKITQEADNNTSSSLKFTTKGHSLQKPQRIARSNQLFDFDMVLSSCKRWFRRLKLDARFISMSLLVLAVFEFETSRWSIQQLEDHVSPKDNNTITTIHKKAPTLETPYVRRKTIATTTNNNRENVGSHHIALRLDHDRFDSINKINLNQFEVIEPDPIDSSGRRRIIIDYPENGDWSICDSGAPPMYDWQDSFYPSCNNIHEIDFDVSQRQNDRDTVSQHINAGYNRDVWEVISADTSKWALKSLRYEKDFDNYMFDQQRIDAVISERLTSSKFVANIYGFCGFSALYDYASEGDLNEHYKELKKEDRLHVAYRLARALADVHTLGGGEFSPIIHADMDARQYIMIDGEYYLNDFNTARLLRWDSLNQRPCPGRMKNHPTDCNRSPDENLIIGWNDVYEGVDVYSLGNQFYRLLMKERKSKGQSTSECLEKLRAGYIPNLPEKLEQSSDPIDKALIHVMKRSLQFDPKKRASAKELAMYLHDAVIEVGNYNKQ
eukprot:CAMPEP_0195285470 /NCGR_PEP_ID=MMETSP0707-20130614/3290_1 /TAXON_ID=33640 /ORGANISM="Asterionellopsis glacialis, Strain CCMP134" /LENGTH=495 /DNA_ID=CAMNT_0040344965 /DNA_START=117 /DNA_END=1604 /DNA_ORIENTATION=+